MIELERVRVVHPRGGSPLLDEATTIVQPREVAILGASTGAGASLLLAAVLGDHPLADGKVALFGRDLSRLRRASLLRLRRRVGVVPQDLRLLGEATALTNVLLPLDIDHVPRHAATVRAAEALGRVGLAAELDVRVDRLSMAERQRVALARALVREPAILIADQPTSHQDPERALTIAKVLAETAAAGATVLVASRDPVLWEVAASEGWRTLALRDGKMIETTAPRAVIDQLSAEIVIEADVIDSEPVPALASITPISAAIAAAEAAEAIPNVVPFPITARSRGQR